MCPYGLVSNVFRILARTISLLSHFTGYVASCDVNIRPGALNGLWCVTIQTTQAHWSFKAQTWHHKLISSFWIGKPHA